MPRTTGVVLTRFERIPPRPAGAPSFAVAGLVAVAHLGLLASAVLGRPVLFAALAVACTALEPVAERVVPLLPWALTRTLLTLPWRWAVTVAALLCLMTVRPFDDGVLSRTVLVAGVVLGLSAALVEGFAELVEHLRKSPVLTRNLRLPGLSLPPHPRWLLTLRARALTPSHLLLVVPPALAVSGTLPNGVVTALLAVSVLLAVAVALAAARVVVATRRDNPRVTVPPAVQEEVTRLAPDLVLYYGGGPDALYQVEMWLQTFEQSRHRTLVVLRDRESLRLMGPTSLPVLCVPAGTVLMSFDLPTVRGALFVANAATNIHLLRKRGMTTAFIGHGDSDKQASSNPFVKVYDELWVAGPAGAERYEGPDTVAVTGRVVEVGRPQARAGGPRQRAAGPATVLYAPTWEGWGDEPYHSSLPFEGVELVRRLLATPGVRLLYRPHPLTGTRSTTVRRAHLEVLGLLRAAGAPDAVAGPSSTAPGAGPSSTNPLDEARLDDLALMAARSEPAPPDPAVAPARAEAENAFWSCAGPDVPRVVEGAWPGLASCFARTDLLIADVSSVVSDWIALDRPYALVNPQGLSREEFVRRYPSSAGGRLLGPGAAGLDALVEDLLEGRDPDAAQRDHIRRHLLGSFPDDGGQRFQAALDRLVHHTAVPDRLG
jgi:hypothetical protein